MGSVTLFFYLFSLTVVFQYLFTTVSLFYLSSLILQLAIVFVGYHAYKDYHKYNELTRTIEDIFMLPVSERMLTEKDRVQGKMYSTK